MKADTQGWSCPVRNSSAPHKVGSSMRLATHCCCVAMPNKLLGGLTKKVPLQADRDEDQDRERDHLQNPLRTHRPPLRFLLLQEAGERCTEIFFQLDKPRDAGVLLWIRLGVELPQLIFERTLTLSRTGQRAKQREFRSNHRRSNK